MPEGHAAGEFNRLVVRTITSATLSLGVLNLTPFLVTVLAGPSQGALFAIALSITQTLDFVIAALAVSLIVHASGAPEQATTMARTVLIRANTVAIVGAVIIVPLAPLALQLLNAQYGAIGANRVIALLSFACVIRTVYTVWAALERSRRNMKAILVLDFVSAALLLAVLPGLCHVSGAIGGAFALLLADLLRTAGAVTYFVTAHRRRRQHKAARVGALSEVNSHDETSGIRP
jgi:O-antigen/teichoic acid export membrane protein